MSARQVILREGKSVVSSFERLISANNGERTGRERGSVLYRTELLFPCSLPIFYLYKLLHSNSFSNAELSLFEGKSGSGQVPRALFPSFFVKDIAFELLFECRISVSEKITSPREIKCKLSFILSMGREHEELFCILLLIWVKELDLG